MKQMNADYTFGIASLEIVSLLLGAFVLGMLLCWLLRSLGICCVNHTSNASESSVGQPRHFSNTTHAGQRTPRDFPGNELRSGGYTADINSLLRHQSETSAPNASAAGLHDNRAIETNTGNTRPGLNKFATGHKDDLKKLEGIGPKLEQILNAAGILNFAQLASMTPEEIKPILEAAGNQFKMHDPKSWPYQAELANKNDWERLKEYQNLLIRGRI